VILLVAATERELVSVDGARPLCCGIGPVEAGIATASALARERPDAVLHVGIAGAPELEPGSVVIGSEAFYSDIVDAASTVPRVERAFPAAELVEAARRALPDARVLPIAPCRRVGGGGACEVEAMEGFSVLRAAELAGVPAVEVRVISNRPADADRGLAQVLGHNISALAGILGHRFEVLRRRLILMPIERAFFPQIEVTHQKYGDVYHNFQEAVHADTGGHSYKVPVNIRPGIQEDGFHVEKNENHRHQIESYGDGRARVARGLHAAFVRLLLRAARPAPAHQHGSSRQRPGQRRGNQQV